MPLSAYLSQNPSDPQEDVNVALSDLEITENLENLSALQEDRDKRKKGKKSSSAFDSSNAASTGSACQQTAGMWVSSG